MGSTEFKSDKADTNDPLQTDRQTDRATSPSLGLTAQPYVIAWRRPPAKRLGAHARASGSAGQRREERGKGRRRKRRRGGERERREERKIRRRLLGRAE